MRIATALFFGAILITLGTTPASAKKPEPSPLWGSLLKAMDAGPIPTLGILQKEEKLVQLKNLSLRVPKGAYLLERDAVGKVLGPANPPWHLDFLECALLMPSTDGEKLGGQNGSLTSGLYLVWFIRPRSGVPFIWSNRAIGIVRKVIGTTGAAIDDFSGIHPTTFYTTIFTETHAYRFHFEYTFVHGNIVLIGHSDRVLLPSNHDKTLLSTANPAQAKEATDILDAAMRRIELEGLDPSNKDINAWIHGTFENARMESEFKFEGKNAVLPESMKAIYVLGENLYSVDTGESVDVEYRVLGNILPVKNGTVSGTLFLLIPREPRLVKPSTVEQEEYLAQVSSWLSWIEADKLGQLVFDHMHWIGWRKPWLTGLITIENVLFIRWTGDGFLGFHGEARIISQSKSDDDQKRIRASVEQGWVELLQAISKLEVDARKNMSAKEGIFSMSDSKALISILGQLEKRFKRVDHRITTDNFTEEEKTFLLVVWLTTQVDNGGWSQFFFNSTGENALETVGALRAIGAERTAGLLEKMNSLFPNGVPPKDLEARNKIVSSWGEKESKIAEESDRAYFDSAEKLESLLVDYAKKHQDKFDI